MQSQRQKIGHTGEDIATYYLIKKGYQILNRNFKTKWGELDIVASHNKTIIFIEVKTLRFNQCRPLDFSPEDEITPYKCHQLLKMTQVYLSANKLPLDIAHQIDILAIELLSNSSIANIRHIKNAIKDC